MAPARYGPTEDSAPRGEARHDSSQPSQRSSGRSEEPIVNRHVIKTNFPRASTPVLLNVALSDRLDIRVRYDSFTQNPNPLDSGSSK